MKKYLGLILAISAITLAAFGAVTWYGEGSAPHPNDTPGKSLQKINSILYSGGIIITGTVVTATNVNITNPSLAVNVTNASLTVTGNVGVTNTPSITGTVGGYTLVTNLTLDVDRTAAGIAANDILAPGLEVAGAVRTSNGTGILKCVTLASGDNVAPAIRLLISGAALTWGTTNAVAYLTGSEFSNVQGIVDFTAADFKLIGTNYFATKDVGVGIRPTATSLFVYAVCTAAITNTNTAGAKLKLTIWQD